MAKAEKAFWVALKPCGCVVGAAIADDSPHIAKERAQWAHDGLQVLYATEAEWKDNYRPKFLADCPHAGAAVSR